MQAARAFIMAYFAGTKFDAKNFDFEDTTPELVPSGAEAADWERLSLKSRIWNDQALEAAGKEYARLSAAQKAAFAKKEETARRLPRKAFNLALLTAWAFVAGVLRNNSNRLKTLPAC